MRIGTPNTMIIQELSINVWKERLRNTASTETGEEWHSSKSAERYRLERAVTMLLKTRREKKVSKIIANRWWARRSPITSTD